ncbi:hypothetical protein [Clostridium sp. ZBS20]|uniref:hypothetical protein n=1 Tax=Clostridium sp. ZBS20 TaxID=2949966 RepID=UPI001D236F09|nr:hypothetical protein [Clostridium sp. ZBS20]HBJ1648970.1 hypothetical protein [Clostridium botulinum]
MPITISYKIKKYNKDHIVYKMKELILKNYRLLEVIANIYILLDDFNNDNRIVNDENEKIICSIIRKSVMSGYITREVAQEFSLLWAQIKSEELGLVLEQIIANIGPCEVFKENYDLSMDVKVDETKIEKDFDVVFFSDIYSKNKNHSKNKKIKISGKSEFHECKKNVCTFIPCDPGKELKEKPKKKLDFIKKTYELHNEGKYFIPTLFPQVESQQRFLNKYEDGIYNFIKILDIYNLIELVNK